MHCCYYIVFVHGAGLSKATIHKCSARCTWCVLSGRLPVVICYFVRDVLNMAMCSVGSRVLPAVVRGGLREPGRSVSSCCSERLLAGLREGSRAALAESVTLVESRSELKREKAAKLMTLVCRDLQQRKRTSSFHTLRVGVSGPPGAGKSSFIARLGRLLVSNDHKLAVLAVDPSSSASGGSLLADKTRMPWLTSSSSAYVRPSPNSGHLGGVTRSTSDAILLCEHSNYDVVFVETVGVGQAELMVADMVDVLLLVLSPSGGDELQGLKRGIVEVADFVVINKSDGDLEKAAMRIQAEYISAVKYMRPRYVGRERKVVRVSSLLGTGVEELWHQLQLFREKLVSSGQLEHVRDHQLRQQLRSHVLDMVLAEFERRVGDDGELLRREAEIASGSVSVREAAQTIVKHLLTVQ